MLQYQHNTWVKGSIPIYVFAVVFVVFVVFVPMCSCMCLQVTFQVLKTRQFVSINCVTVGEAGGEGYSSAHVISAIPYQSFRGRFQL